MAIKPIKKIKILVHQDEVNSLFSFLQEQSIFQVEEYSLDEDGFLPYNSLTKTELNVFLSELKLSINFLEPYEKKEFFDKFFNPKISMTNLSYSNETFGICKTTVERIKKLLNERDILDDEHKHLTKTLDDLRPWINVEVDLDQLFSTRWTRSIAGSVDIKQYAELKNIVEENESIIIPVSQKDNQQYFGILCFYTLFDELSKHVNSMGTIIRWDEHGCNSRQLFDKALRKKKIVEHKLQRIEKYALKLLPMLNNLKIIYDVLFNEYIKEDKKTLASSYNDKIVILRGWIAEEDINMLESGMETQFPTAHFILEEPSDDDVVPVILDNKKIVQPFEIITSLYGYPNKNSFDPTPYLMPFYFIFFGLCLADAGYGIILMISAIFTKLILKKRKTTNAFKFLNFLFALGLTTFLCGALTGGFFGNILYKLPEKFSGLAKFSEKITLFSPATSKGALIFLGLSLLLGFIHLWFGVFLSLIHNFKTRNYHSVLFENLPTLGIQSSLLPLALYFVLGMTSIPKFIISIFLLILVTGIILISVDQWRKNDGIFIKLFWCLYANYSVVTGNFLSDTLSYARLFALGLSGGLLALAINEISMVFVNIPVVGFVFVMIIFIFGHAFNLGISFLGAFVHTCRLQYLEFFTKFFESGGVEFVPFKEERIYTVDEKN